MAQNPTYLPGYNISRRMDVDGRYYYEVLPPNSPAFGKFSSYKEASAEARSHLEQERAKALKEQQGKDSLPTVKVQQEMEVIVVDNPNRVPFTDLPLFAPFLWAGHLYLKSSGTNGRLLGQEGGDPVPMNVQHVEPVQILQVKIRKK